VDDRWLEAFFELKGVNSVHKIGDELPVSFHQVEDWHDLIIKMVNEIEQSLSK